MQTTKTATASKRVSREQRVDAAYKSLRRDGAARYNELVELFSVASQSDAGVRYQITHDTVTGVIECGCPAGQHHRECIHAEAVQMYLNFRAVALIKATDEAVQARYEDEQRERDTSVRRSNAFSFWA